MEIALLSVLVLSPAFISAAAEQVAEVPEVSPPAQFFPVSYEDTYGADPLTLNAVRRSMRCTVVDMASADAFREEIAALGGAYELKRIEGQYVVVSTGKAPEGFVAHKNHLDQPISLSLKNATVWEALKQFNLRLAALEAVDAIPYVEIAFDSGRPEEIWRQPIVTINVEDVPARKVLLKIVDQCEVPLAYFYRYYGGELGGRPFPMAQLSISVYNEWGDVCFWVTEDGRLIPLLNPEDQPYHGEVLKRAGTREGNPVLTSFVEEREANAAWYAEQERLMNLAPLPDE
jgi:hypothetical protein